MRVFSDIYKALAALCTVMLMPSTLVSRCA
jgi:hypothetical protein